jgi:hypothetical protein
MVALPQTHTIAQLKAVITEHNDAVQADISEADVRLRQNGQDLKSRLTLQQAGLCDNAKVTLIVRIIGGSKSEELMHNEAPTATAPADPAEMPALLVASVASGVSILSPVPPAAPVIDTAFEQQTMEPNMQQLEQMAKVVDGSFEQQLFKTRANVSCPKCAVLDMPGPSPPSPEATPNGKPTSMLPFDKKTVVSYSKITQKLEHIWPVPCYAKCLGKQRAVSDANRRETQDVVSEILRSK